MTKKPFHTFKKKDKGKALLSCHYFVFINQTFERFVKSVEFLSNLCYNNIRGFMTIKI